MSFTGMSPDKKFVEIIELHEDHPWFLGCQFHPELKSKPFACHPLFRDFIRAARAHRAATQGEAQEKAAQAEAVEAPVAVSRETPCRTRPRATKVGGSRSLPVTRPAAERRPSSSQGPASSSRGSTPSRWRRS